jgi:2-aminomuconate deaminase
MKNTIESSRAPEPVGAFPHAKRVGDLFFLSGIGPRVRGSSEIPGVTLDSAGNVVSYDIETQCRAVFENVRLVLEDAGATWQDIVDVTVFLQSTIGFTQSTSLVAANLIRHAPRLRSAHYQLRSPSSSK